jgi:hypothetical protein
MILHCSRPRVAMEDGCRCVKGLNGNKVKPRRPNRGFTLLPFAICGSSGRAPGSTTLLQRVVARTAEVARSNVLKRTGVRGVLPCYPPSALWTKRSFALRVLNGFEGFTLLLGRPIRLTSALNCISDVVRGRRYFSDGLVADSCDAIWLSISCLSPVVQLR